MAIADYFSIGILGLIFGAQLIKRPFKLRIVRAFSLLSVIIVVGVLSYLSFSQYSVWQKAGPPASYLLPPYQGIGYFLFYVFFRFWAAYSISFMAGILVFFTSRYFNKKYEERFFYSEEYYLSATAVFLTGHPFWLIYLVLILSFWFFVSAFRLLVLKKTERVSFYYFWLPAAVSVILIKELLFSWEFLRILQL